MKLPWAKFYHADWRADAALAMCSPSTRGIWLEMLCIMWQNNTDHISGTLDQLARLCRCTPAEVEAATKEIRSAGVAETVNGGAVYTLTSRRRARELQVSQIKSDAGKQGGRPSVSEKQTESKTKANEKAPSASASASASESEPPVSQPPVQKSDNRKPESKEAVVAYAVELGLPASDGESVWDKWQGNGFTNGGKPMKDWRAVLRSWKGYSYLPSQKQSQGQVNNRVKGTFNEGKASQYANGYS